jgi:hypothetical protein
MLSKKLYCPHITSTCTVRYILKTKYGVSKRIKSRLDDKYYVILLTGIRIREIN